MKELNNGDSPEIIISDIGLPGLSGDEGIAENKMQLCRTLKLLMLTVHQDDEKIFKCLKNGAYGLHIKKCAVK
ncbi:MAG: hypothetical protein U5K00_19050 [Melioribacteraceae bacterium]|nr:hypothetical protein [Melioribacteraceae bacterium]